MISKKIENIESFSGEEGTEIRQIFHPHNTLNGISFSLAHSIILPGKSSKPHKMKSAEVYFVLEGKGTIHVDDEIKEIHQNESVYVPPMSRQFLDNTGNMDLRVLCIVDPAWRQENEILD